MTQRRLAVAAAITLGLGMMAQMSAVAKRPVRIWQADELLKTADVVAIATAQSEDLGVPIPNLPQESRTPMTTSFAVQAVIKGKVANKKITVLHYRYADPQDEIRVVDGAAYIRFDLKKKPVYLLFLKRDRAGALEPVTGQYDPSQSFNRLATIWEK